MMDLDDKQLMLICFFESDDSLDPVIRQYVIKKIMDIYRESNALKLLSSEAQMRYRKLRSKKRIIKGS